MKQCSTQSAGKRPRGRPKGTAPFEERDRGALSRFADQFLQAPGAKLAPFLTSMGYKGKDIRRAQARWRKEKDELLRQAQHRLDRSPGESLAQLIFNLHALVGNALESAEPVLRKFAASQERARRYARALDVEGDGSELPVDLEDSADVDAAIERYETQMFRSEEDRFVALGHHTLKDLPPSLKLYAAAIMLHQMSLDMADREAAGPSSDPEPTDGEDRK